MTTLQQVQQEIVSLPEKKLQELMDFGLFLKWQPQRMTQISHRTSASLSAKELSELSHEERQAIIARQFQKAAALYSDNPEIVVPDIDVPDES